jgi:LuxR family transcriptional regulator, maltose regulon positive regulatory protein
VPGYLFPEGPDGPDVAGHGLTPRRALERQLLLAAAAIESGDPMAASTLGEALHAARSQGFLNTVIATAPQVTAYLIEHAAQMRPDPFINQLVATALDVRAAAGTAVPATSWPSR